MSDIDYRQFITNFCNRTDKNLKIIENEHKNDPESEAYEFTQLINSLFGLIIVPYERFRHRKKDKKESKEEYEKQKFASTSIRETKLAKTPEGIRLKEIIKKLEGQGKIRNNGYPNDYPISYFVGHIRNSLAHMGNYGALFCGNGEELTGVIFYDHEGTKEYCIELEYEPLKEIVDLITHMYLRFDELSEEKGKEYEEMVISRRRFLEGE